LTRREFLERVFYAGLGGGIIAVLGGITRFIIPPKRRSDIQSVAIAGRVAEFGITCSKKIMLGREPVYVIKKDDSLIAVSAICTHAGCIVKLDEEKKWFVCPCHNGIFDISGRVKKGPPTSALPRYNVEIKDDIVYVKR
jgi:cytochrome b6-f complex iron-sulfur subunit